MLTVESVQCLCVIASTHTIVLSKELLNCLIAVKPLGAFLTDLSATHDVSNFVLLLLNTSAQVAVNNKDTPWVLELLSNLPLTDKLVCSSGN